jgi:hypothetical protein
MLLVGRPAPSNTVRVQDATSSRPAGILGCQRVLDAAVSLTQYGP